MTLVCCILWWKKAGQFLYLISTEMWSELKQSCPRQPSMGRIMQRYWIVSQEGTKQFCMEVNDIGLLMQERKKERKKAQNWSETAVMLETLQKPLDCHACVWLLRFSLQPLLINTRETEAHCRMEELWGWLWYIKRYFCQGFCKQWRHWYWVETVSYLNTPRRAFKEHQHGSPTCKKKNQKT